MHVSLRFLDPVRPSITLARRRARLGRGVDNDVVLEGGHVAPLHAVLEQRESELLVRDLSGDGVHVNRRRVYSAALRHGDQLRIGEHHLEVDIGGLRAAARVPDETAPEADDGAPSSRGVTPLAVRIQHAHGWRVHPLEDRQLYFGKSAACDLVVNHPTVSRWHACLEVVDGQRVVRDLCSKNGLRVAGVRVQHAPVGPNVEVRLGAARLQFIDARLAAALLEDAAPFEGLVGVSPPMRALYAAIEEAGPSDESVLVLGETGSGKELVARAVHARSRRKDGPYVAVNCGALPRELAESELFGHERGAFSGAVALRRGYFEEASGGTLFLDEVVELSMEAQAKLLRTLETGELRRVGGEGTRRIDVRVVAAANRPLLDVVREGRFRLDLYHRLCVVQLRVPPLRARVEDIAALVRHFLPADRVLTEQAMEKLVAHPWPGNVRELRNVVRRAALRSRGPLVDADELLLDPFEALTPPAPPTHVQGLAELEKLAIAAALEATGGNKSAAARLLGVSRSALWEKMKRVGLSR